MTDVSAISEQLLEILTKISEINDVMNSKSWYFSGAKTFHIKHGVGDDYYDQDLQMDVHYDNSTEAYTTEMYYDPRYYSQYVYSYNTTFTKYAIAPTDIGATTGYMVIDLTKYKTYLASYIEASSSEKSTYHDNALRVYSAALTMNKLELTEPTNWRTGRDSTETWTDYLTSNLSSQFIEEANNIMDTIKREIFNIATTITFTYYKAEVDDSNLWYETEQDKTSIAELITTYEELYNDLIVIAKAAASSGGTIVNCIVYAYTNITNSQYSYITISQILSCIANNITTTVDGETYTDNVNEIIAELEEVASEEEQKSMDKTAIFICIIVCILILVFWVIELVVVKIFVSNEVSNHSSEQQ